MADVKWIKITTDMFDNRKIKHLRRLPEGNSIVLIWVMLLTMAGRCNSNGMIFLTENIPYTPKMLADELDFEENTVQLALQVLEQLGMVICDNGYFAIAGWEEYQNIEGMERIREQTRQRVAKYRATKSIAECNVTSNVTVTQGNATDIDIEEDIDKDIENNNKAPAPSHKSSKSEKDSYGIYQNVLLSFEEYEKLVDYVGEEATKKAITFLDEYIEEKGYKSKSHYLAIKRWVIQAVNEYEAKQHKSRSKNKFQNFEQREYDFDELEKLMGKKEEK